jgi:hypothetical protein
MALTENARFRLGLEIARDTTRQRRIGSPPQRVRDGLSVWISQERMRLEWGHGIPSLRYAMAFEETGRALDFNRMRA